MFVTTALVLSAGGMFAAWEVGVWKALRARMQFDLIVGASAGAWNGWAIAGGCTPEELAQEWMDPRTAQLMQPGLHCSGILRPDAMHQKARELFDRYRPRLPFGLTVMEVPRFQTRLVRAPEITWQHLAATASIPLCFPPVTILGRNYVDGGFPCNALPLWAAAEMGATRAMAVLCLTTLPFRMLRRVVPPRKFSSALEVIRFEPSEPLGSLHEAISWSAANVARWIDLGERDANRTLLSITM
jgi:predicted acylesterase/phospholipase RssA